MFEYDGRLARWWHARCSDRAHEYAYRNIAGYIHSSYASGPRLAVDYACGAGNMLCRLATPFPECALVGIDGSSHLLELARKRLSHLGPRVRLIHTQLPDFSLPALRADLAIFAFPNMVPPTHDPRLRGASLRLSGDDLQIALDLARGRQDAFMLTMGRLIALNLRSLLRRGGICIRAEYGRAKRDELGRDDLLRVSFEEGSLDVEVNGKRPRQWFRILASSYFRSRVIEDVYQQTGDSDDRTGGYLITVLQAV